MIKIYFLLNLFKLYGVISQHNNAATDMVQNQIVQHVINEKTRSIMEENKDENQIESRKTVIKTNWLFFLISGIIAILFNIFMIIYSPHRSLISYITINTLMYNLFKCSLEIYELHHEIYKQKNKME